MPGRAHPQLYTTTGTLPTQPLYAVPTSKSVQRREMAEAGHRKTRAPRKPTPFNFFIKASRLHYKSLRKPGSANAQIVCTELASHGRSGQAGDHRLYA